MSQAIAYTAAPQRRRVAPVPAVEALRRRVKGAVIEPGGDGWDAATQAFNLTFRQDPALTAVPADEQDVIRIVEFARAQEMQVTAQRTGHNAEPLGDALDQMILAKTDAM